MVLKRLRAEGVEIREGALVERVTGGARLVDVHISEGGVPGVVQGTNLLDANNISNLQPSLWPQNQINGTSYRTYYSETGRAGGAFLTLDQNGDGIEDWFPVNDPRVFEPGRVLRLGLGVQF